MEHSYDTKQAVLQDMIDQQAVNLDALARKRSWTPSEKAMAAATYKKRIEVLEQVREDLFRLEDLED